MFCVIPASVSDDFFIMLESVVMKLDFRSIAAWSRREAPSLISLIWLKVAWFPASDSIWATPPNT